MIDLWSMGQQWSCGKTTQHKPPGIGSTQLDQVVNQSRILFTVVSFISISALNRKTYISFVVFFSDAFVAVRQRHFPLPLYRLLPPGSEQAQRRNKLQSRPRDGDRASASGVSLRRGDAEVQVGELPPLSSIFKVSLCFTRCFSFFA